MKINLTERQFELLLQLVYLGRFTMNIVEDPRKMSPEEGEVIQLVKHLYHVAHTSGIASELVSVTDGKLYSSLEMERRTGEIIQALHRDGFIDKLSGKLAHRDMVEKYGKTALEEMEDKSWLQYRRLLDVAMEPYQEEFHKNGIQNLRLVLAGK